MRPIVQLRSSGNRISGHRVAIDAAVATLLFGLAFLTHYASAALIVGRTHSPAMAYFDHLAAAFLRGELHLAAPPATHDLTLHAGRWYVPFPPLPALLMLPFVAAFGLAGANTVVFSSAIAGLNVALCYALIRGLASRGWSRLGRSGALWLTVMFGWGSVHWYMSTPGSVWFVGQLCTLTFILLAALFAVSIRRPFLAALCDGCALALAMLARPHIATIWALLFGIMLQRIFDGQSDSALNAARAPPGKIAWQAALTLAPVLAAVLILLMYNRARFGSFFDFGYLNQNVAGVLLDDLRTYGQFNLHFWPRNVWAMLLALPEFDASAGVFAPSPYGMSLLLTTPALIYLIYAVRRPAHPFLIWGAWIAVGCTVAVLLSYYNTGAAQFGYRFSLDFITPVIVLLACSLARVSALMRALILIGVLVNAYGVAWFAQFAGF
jgi:hypothetical protein